MRTSAFWMTSGSSAWWTRLADSEARLALPSLKMQAKTVDGVAGGARVVRQDRQPYRAQGSISRGRGRTRLKRFPEQPFTLDRGRQLGCPWGRRGGPSGRLGCAAGIRSSPPGRVLLRFLRPERAARRHQPDRRRYRPADRLLDRRRDLLRRTERRERGRNGVRWRLRDLDGAWPERLGRLAPSRRGGHFLHR